MLDTGSDTNPLYIEVYYNESEYYQEMPQE